MKNKLDDIMYCIADKIIVAFLLTYNAIKKVIK